MWKFIKHQAAVGTSLVSSTVRGWRGTMQKRGDVPFATEITLELYEFEGCPFCRLVRETITELQLDVMIYPCPPGGERFRPRAYELAGKETTFPFLVDKEMDVVMSESKDIIEHLWQTRAGRSAPARSPLAIPTSAFASLVRGRRGAKVRSSRSPEQPLELFSFESSPYSRLVREVLCELELPYTLWSGGKEQIADIGPTGFRLHRGEYHPVEGGRRATMAERGIPVQFPVLIDPNTEQTIANSDRIIAYLEKTYLV
ncbi:MAG: glutathione S-transferase N-terminal domain-containing protein [Myxococcota bacterium]|nr:glutathione S-transferase N-terminal domain-containing protein [Myxococcota bacterium]